MARTSKKKRPFVIAYGGEDFLIDRIADTARRTAEFEDYQFVRLDGDRIDGAKLVSICENRPVDGRDRIVLLDNAQKVKGKLLEQYIADKAITDTSVMIFVLVRADKVPAPWDAAIAKSQAMHFPKFHPWQVDQKIGRILAESTRVEVKLSKDMAGLLLRLVGDDLGLIVNELRKMFYIVGKGGTIKREHIALVVPKLPPAEPYQVAEAAADKNLKRAMDLTSLVYKYMGDGASVPICFSLMKQTERLIVSAQMLEKGDSPEVIATRFDMHPFAFKKNLLPMVRKHKIADLRKQMQNLCRLDSQVKSAARSKRTRVELAVLSLAS